MQVKKIFLASSAELEEDRRAFQLMFTRLNPQWRSRELTFDVVLWESFIDAMSKEGLQQEYNKAARDCDIFVMLFFTKVGPYTLQEFETAFATLKEGARPLIYTYFRNDYVLTGDLDERVRSLLAFKDRLRELKHYPTSYRNAEDLQWQFSRQLEQIYGGDGASAEISDATPQSRVDEIALLLCHRQLFGDGASTPEEAKRLQAAVQRAGRYVREAVFGMASSVRREAWIVDKRRMERTIPLFEALTRADSTWHAPFAQLGFALKDKPVPDWERSLEALTHAIELRGDRLGEGGPFYHWARAECLIHLDPRFKPGKPADPATKASVLEALRQARRELEDGWEAALDNSLALDVRNWLQFNGSPRLR
jgi:hypothetical protein